MKMILKLLLSIFCISILFTPNKVDAVTVDRNRNFTKLGSIINFSNSGNVVNITYSDGSLGKITFLEPQMFRYNIEPSNDFVDVPTRSGKGLDKARITLTNDNDSRYSKPSVNVREEEGNLLIESDKILITIEKQTSLLSITNKETSKKVLAEAAPLSFLNGYTSQTLTRLNNEQFFGGGMQNGRFNHTNQSIKIVNTNNWVDGGVASPNPFYWSTSGIGVVRHTFAQGNYNFDKEYKSQVVTAHNERRFDAYYFVNSDYSQLINEYYHLTGKPNMPKLSALYLGHLNCYNRDTWVEANNGILFPDGKRYREFQPAQLGNRVGIAESLNGYINKGDSKTTIEGGYQFSARAVIDEHIKHNMPLGWFLPNDGYGCGYGKDSTNFDSNIQNLKEFGDYAREKGVDIGLWTQSNLWRNDKEKNEILQRDIDKEVDAGLSFLKTDVAWVGYGYSFGLNGLEIAYPIMAKNNVRPDVITLDGWAGTQRYGGIWTGDQSGGNWEYIRFTIPTYIGSALGGQPNNSSDMDGIFGGGPKIQVRDFQWKTFTTMQLDMDGWGSAPKKPYAYGEPYTSINRYYLKLKSQLMPYLYNELYRSLNGVPFNRAMFINYPNDAYAYTTNTQYQFMVGKDFLVAPIYKNTNMQENGDDIRNNIYLPDANQLWIDYFTGQKYRGGQVLNNFQAPFHKLPLFVRDGAIIPMYLEHNNPQEITASNPKGLDRSYRLFEFYPSGSNTYTLVEDDGKTINYNKGATTTYGQTLTTKIDSVVDNNVATLTINASSGSVDNIPVNRSSEFIVNVSKKPSSIEVSVNNSNVDLVEVADLDTLRKTPNSYVYVESPDLNVFSTPNSPFESVKMITNPKLYVHVAKNNVNSSVIKLVLNDFSNDYELGVDSLNSNLLAPNNLTYNLEASTAYTNDLVWDSVENATSYEIEADGIIKTNLLSPHFVDENLVPNSLHTYRVRSRNVDGYSEWSAPLEVRTIQDPYLNVIKENVTMYHDSQDQPGDGLKKAYDNDLGTMWHTRWTKVKDQDITYLVIDLNKAYDLDKLEYYPRDNGGNGAFISADVEVSLDGKHWTNRKVINFDRNRVNTISLNGQRARYVRFNKLKTVGGFGSAREIMVYSMAPISNHKHLLGDLNNDKLVNVDDFEFIKNYAFSTKGDSYFDYVNSVHGDINYNNTFDIYDIAFIHQQVDNTLVKNRASGQIYLDVSKSNIASNQLIEIPVMGVNLENVYAYSIDLNIDYTQFNKITLISNKQGYTYSLNEPNTKNHWTVGFVAKNQSERINGSNQIATLQLQPKNSFDISKLSASGILVGSDRDEIKLSNILGQQKNYLARSDFDVTYTNDIVPNDDGNNKNILFQDGANGEARLYDGNLNNLSEFKWYYGPNNFPDSVKLPTDFTYNFKKPVNLEAIEIVKRTAGNGTLNKVEIQAFNNDDLLFNQTIDSVPETLIVSLNKEDVITKLIITPLESSGVASGASNPNNRMLTLKEISFVGNYASEKEVIKPAKEMPLPLSDFTSILFTNSKLPTDQVKEGSVLGINGYKLFKAGGNGTPDPIFDLDHSSMAEFSWALDGTGFDDYTRVPLTITFNLKEVKEFNKLLVVQRPQANANGRIKSLQLFGVVNGKDKLIAKMDNVVALNEIVLTATDTINTNVLKLEILETTGNDVSASGVSASDKLNRMLTINEISLFGTEAKVTEDKVADLDVSDLNELLNQFSSKVIDSYLVNDNNEKLIELKNLLQKAKEFVGSNPKDLPENVEIKSELIDKLTKLSKLLSTKEIVSDNDYVTVNYAPAVFGSTSPKLVVSKDADSDSQIVYSIKFMSDGKELQPQLGRLNLALKVNENWTDQSKINIVHIFGENNQRENIQDFALNNSIVEFSVDHLSSFEINYISNDINNNTENTNENTNANNTNENTNNDSSSTLVLITDNKEINKPISKVVVSDINNLTIDDKNRIEAAFRLLNPNATLTITFINDQIVVNDRVFNINDVASASSKVLPNTGVDNYCNGILALCLMIGGYLIINRKNYLE